MSETTLPAIAENLVFDGEPRDQNGIVAVAWEVLDDYGNVVQRASWANGKEWVDPSLAPIDHLPALKEKARAARAGALRRVLKLTEADLPMIEEEQEPGEIIPVSENVRGLWHELGLVLTEKKQPVPNADNILRVLEGLEVFHGRVWLDEFTGTIMCGLGNTEREWTDADTRKLWLEVQRRLSIPRIGKETVFEALSGYAEANKRHPVKEWLAGIQWDKVPRIGGFFHDYLGADDSAFTRAASRNFFVAMIARVFAPGCKVDNMVVLEGAQGARKSSALKALCGKWFTECNDPISNGSNKDFYAVLQGKMLVEIAELDSFSRADIRRIKAIITTATDRYRPAYGRIAQNFPRTSVFVGTTNEDEYLEDATGGRRFWPVRVGLVDLDGILRDRDQLFAEALHAYRVGGKWYEMPDEAAAVQESRRSSDEWEGVIAAWLRKEEAVLIQAPPTTLQIATKGLNFSEAGVDKRAANRIGYCMKVLGYRACQRWNGLLQMNQKVWVKR